MFEIEYLVATGCILFFAFVALVSVFSSSKSADQVAMMADELEQKNQEIRLLEQQLYKEKFFKDVKNNDK